MNRLAKTRSPYLHQHQDNPVHWQPWDNLALQQAQKEDKPILLSIGYSACHWCHVMAHESFADAATAELMNRHFINIKVDREERPDLDKIYQTSHYLLARQGGGWPLTVFLTPEGIPFFSGTYFPKHAAHGLTPFTEVLQKVQAAWVHQRPAIAKQNSGVLAFLQQLNSYPQPSVLDGSIIDNALQNFEELFSPARHAHQQPKFPHPVELLFCLQQARLKKRPTLENNILTIVDQICQRGLFDHLHGGFFRYCVDSQWRLPHFEKMLYDNALIIPLLVEADPAKYAPTVQSTIDWLLSQMCAPDGCFYASMDADTDEGEGAYYLWDKAQIKQLLSPPEYTIARHVWGLDGVADSEGKWHLQHKNPIDNVPTTASDNPTTNPDSIAADTATALLTAAKNKLRAHKRALPPPPLDRKILCAWNALAIKSLIHAARRYQNTAWLQSAQKALRALLASCRPAGATVAVCYEGQRGENGYLDDCAFLLAAVIEMLHADFSAEWLNTAISLADELRDRYYDSDGGFYFTDNRDPSVIHRIKSFEDSATPNGNGIACLSLLKLSRLVADSPPTNTADLNNKASLSDMAEMADKSLTLFSQRLEEQPTAAASLLAALDQTLHPTPIVWLCGDVALCQQWQQQLESPNNPPCWVFILPPQQHTLPAYLQKPAPASGAYAYVCDQHRCQPPIDNYAALHSALAQSAPQPAHQPAPQPPPH